MNKNFSKDPPQPLGKTADKGSQYRGGVTLAVGDEAPEFDLPDDAGGSVRLKNYRGQLLVLYFYPKDETPGCTREACAFRDFYAEYQRRGVTIFGVSQDTEQSHRKFIERRALPFPLVADPEGSVARAYGVPTRSMGTRFPKFRENVHIFEPEKLPAEGTRYMFIDPASARNWYMLWCLVDALGRHWI